MTWPSPDRYARMERLHDDCEALEPVQRIDHLDRSCADDPALAAEVLAMFADAIPGHRFSASVERAGRTLLQPATGTSIGPYRVLRELGHGGMGSVFLARRADGAFDRDVAIKLLRGFPSSDALRRLRREREILARLDHPHIARLLDGGESRQGQPYLVLEYVAGARIDRHADARQLDITGRIDLFLAVCEAIASAHRQLVVHRDIKPANVLVDNEGRVKVLDFGIARLLAEAQDSNGDPHSQSCFATPEYASPEQLRGAAVTTASDIYSLGMLLAQLLAGRAAAQGPSSLAPSRWSSIANAAAAQAIEPARLRAALRGDLDAILCCAMDPDVGRRYRDVQALIDDLDRYRQGRPVRARRAGVLYACGKFLRRHGWPLLGITLGAGLLLGIAARAVVIQRRAALEAQVVRGVSAVMRDVYSGLDGRDRGAISARQYVAEGLAQLSAAPHIEPLVRARLHFLFGLSMANLGELDTAHAMLDRSIAMRESQLGRMDTESVRIRAARLQLSLSMEDASRAGMEWAALAAVDADLYPLDVEDRIERDSLEGQYAALRGEDARATFLLERAYAQAKRHYGHFHVRVAPHAMRRAEHAIARHQWTIATEAADHALAIYLRVIGPEAHQTRRAAALRDRMRAAADAHARGDAGAASPGGASRRST